jgi:RNA polymerase sigma-70 factor (ECF subfamily)
MRGRARFRGESEFSTWLRSIAVNALRDFIKAKQRRRELAGADVGEAAIDEFWYGKKVSGGISEEVQRLREAMDHLTPRQRHLIEWKYGDGLTYDEIASRLSSTPTAVSQALRRARLTLKRTMESDDLARQ